MATWEQNKNYILSKVADGTADAGMQAWYDTWVAAGSPSTQQQLQTWKSQNTGAQDGIATYWNPDKGLYQTDPYSSDNWQDYKVGGRDSDYGYYINSEGAYVYGKMPAETHQYYDGDGYVTVEGPDPTPSNPPPSQHGMAEGGGQFYGDPTDPENTGNIEDQDWYQPPAQVPYDPWAAGKTGWAGGSTPLDWGGGQQQTVAPVGGGGQLGQMPTDNPLIGYEGSTNRDFYQQQFKDMRDRRASEINMERAAALRAQEAKNAPSAAPTDPWAWAGGSASMAPQVAGGTANEPYTWDLREGVTAGETTNQQIVDLLGQRDLLSPADLKAFGRHQQNDPNWATATDWSKYQSPDKFMSTFSAGNPNVSPEFTDIMGNVANSLWTRSDLTPTGGPAAAPGYALPTGVG
jgi:hypothetical protein